MHPGHQLIYTCYQSPKKYHVRFELQNMMSSRPQYLSTNLLKTFKNVNH